MSEFRQSEYPKIIVLICLVTIFGYPPFALSGSARVLRGGHQGHGTKQIPDSTVRAGKGRLQNPSTDPIGHISNNQTVLTKPRDSQTQSGKSVTPPYGAMTLDPGAAKTPLVNGEHDRPNLPPLKKKEEEESGQPSHTCDEGNIKQGCPGYTSMEKDLIQDKLREK